MQNCMNTICLVVAFDPSSHVCREEPQLTQRLCRHSVPPRVMQRNRLDIPLPKVRFALPATERETWPARQKRMASWGPLVRQVKLIQLVSLCWGMLVRLQKKIVSFRPTICLHQEVLPSGSVQRLLQELFCNMIYQPQFS